MASVSGGGAPTVTAQDPTTITGTRGGTPALNIGILANPTTFTQGGTAAYTFTITNNGGASTSGTVTLEVTLDPNLTFPSNGVLTGMGWSCTNSTQTCTNGGTIAPSQSFSPITMDVNVNTNAPATVTTQAVVSGGGAPVNTGQPTNPVNP